MATGSATSTICPLPNRTQHPSTCPTWWGGQVSWQFPLLAKVNPASSAQRLFACACWRRSSR
eukprot:5034438-Amphidinium_carterae.1